MEVNAAGDGAGENGSIGRKRLRSKLTSSSPLSSWSPAPSGDGFGDDGSGRLAGYDEYAVVQLGSYQTRYGAPRDQAPKVMRTMVAFRRKVARKEEKEKDEEDRMGISADVQFDVTVRRIVADTKMEVRHRGGGKPVPWVVKVETLPTDDNDSAVDKPSDEDSKMETILVGQRAAEVEMNGDYDVVCPLLSGRLNRTDHTIGPIRAALWRLLEAAANGAKSMILIVPEESTRTDVIELVDAAFQVKSVQRVFVHHTSAAAAFGAGLSSCVVIDVGHSGGYVVCVEDGSTIADTRVKLRYGGAHLLGALRRLVDEYGEKDMCEMSAMEKADMFVCMKEEMCDASAEENDSVAVANVTSRSGRRFRMRVGIGPRVTSVMGLFYPNLLLAALPPKPDGFEVEADDDETRWLESLVDDTARSAKAAAARPLGYFGASKGGFMPLDEAISTSVIRATEGHGSEKKSELRRFLSAVLLVGGSVRVHNLSRALEQSIKDRIEAGLIDADPKTVDVLIGGKEMDAAALAWKGGAVLAQTESVNDMFVSASEWSARNVRSLREKCPFFW